MSIYGQNLWSERIKDNFFEKALKGRLSPPLVASGNAKAWKGKSKRFKKGIDKKKHPHPLGRAATISFHFTIN